MKKQLIASFALTLPLLLGASHASAALIGVHYEGTITQASHGLQSLRQGITLETLFLVITIMIQRPFRLEVPR